MKMSLNKALETSSVEQLNDTPRIDLATLAFVRSTTAKVRKNNFFYTCAVVSSRGYYMDKIVQYIKVLFLSLVLILVTVFFAVKIHDKLFGYNIYAIFSELDPLSQKVPVYYRGNKIGRVKRIKPGKDYKYTIMKVFINTKKLALPDNTIAKVKKLDNGQNYIDLIYPKVPSEVILKNGSMIEGKMAVDIEDFMSELADSGDLTVMKDNIKKTLEGIQTASEDIGTVFELLNYILEENRNNLKKTTHNAAKISNDLNEASKKLNVVIDEQELKNTFSNANKSSEDVKQTAKNLKEITENVDKATQNLDKTVAKIDNTVSEVNVITCNVKQITNTFCQVLKKRFAGMRILFGKPSS